MKSNSRTQEKVIEKLYYLRNYTILHFVFLNKNEPASKNVGIEARPVIMIQSNRQDWNSMENRLEWWIINDHKYE